MSDGFVKLQKQVFGTSDKPDALLALAEKYLKEGYYNHAAAAATAGSAQFSAAEGDFKAILGCSLIKLNLLSEANYHLKKASSYKDLADRCRSELLQRQNNS